MEKYTEQDKKILKVLGILEKQSLPAYKKALNENMNREQMLLKAEEVLDLEKKINTLLEQVSSLEDQKNKVSDELLKEVRKIKGASIKIGNIVMMVHTTISTNPAKTTYSYKSMFEALDEAYEFGKGVIAKLKKKYSTFHPGSRSVSHELETYREAKVRKLVKFIESKTGKKVHLQEGIISWIQEKSGQLVSFFKAWADGMIKRANNLEKIAKEAGLLTETKKNIDKKKINESINQPEYTFYVCEVISSGIKINEGFESKEDALSRIKEQKNEGHVGDLNFKVISKRYLQQKGIDPNDDKNWGNPSYMKETKEVELKENKSLLIKQLQNLRRTSDESKAKKFLYKLYKKSDLPKIVKNELARACDSFDNGHLGEWQSAVDNAIESLKRNEVNESTSFDKEFDKNVNLIWKIYKDVIRKKDLKSFEKIYKIFVGKNPPSISRFGDYTFDDLKDNISDVIHNIFDINEAKRLIKKLTNAGFIKNKVKESSSNKFFPSPAPKISPVGIKTKVISGTENLHEEDEQEEVDESAKTDKHRLKFGRNRVMEDASDFLISDLHPNEDISFTTHGQILGYTRNKKPVYINAHAHSYKDFDNTDHSDARKLHLKHAKNSIGVVKKTAEILANEHHKAAVKKVKKRMNEMRPDEIEATTGRKTKIVDADEHLDEARPDEKFARTGRNQVMEDKKIKKDKLVLFSGSTDFIKKYLVQKFKEKKVKFKTKSGEDFYGEGILEVIVSEEELKKHGFLAIKLGKYLESSSNKYIRDLINDKYSDPDDKRAARNEMQDPYGGWIYLDENKETIDEEEILDEEKYPWNKCISDQKKKYGSKETAKKVCGSIKAKSGK